MTAHLNEITNKWDAKFAVKIDGEWKHKTKRGFLTEEEALRWEEEFRQEHKPAPEMPFRYFGKQYLEEVKNNVKESTFATKKNMIETWVIPFFADKRLSQITGSDLDEWREMIDRQVNANGKPFSETYKRSLSNQVSAIFMYAVRKGYIKSSPAPKTKVFGSKDKDCITYWTLDEYMDFISCCDDPELYLICQLFYWTGISTGELLALTRGDYDNVEKSLKITKIWDDSAKDGDKSSPLGNECRMREVSLPPFLAEELEEYLEAHAERTEESDRLFPYGKNNIHRRFTKTLKKSGVTAITMRELRHSHVALLVLLGCSMSQIGNRIGSSEQDVAKRYKMLFKTDSTENRLQSLYEEEVKRTLKGKIRKRLRHVADNLEA